MKLIKDNLLLILIITVATFLRFNQLDNVPAALYQDETSIGYSAYSILETGRDEYGKSFPLYFKSFGDWKLPVYIYSTVPAIAIFGLTPFSVRFPSAIFGVLSVLVFYFFVRSITKNKNLALLSSFLLAINPWSLHYNRATFEVSIALFFFIFGGYLLNKFFSTRASGAFLGGVLSFVIAFYSYNLTRLLAPLLFVFILFVNRSYIKKSSIKELLISTCIGFLMLIPFVLSLFDKGGVSSASGTLINSSAVVQAPLQEFRAYASALPLGFGVIFNKIFMTIWQYIVNISSYFSVNFFFINGSAHGNHGIGNVGLFYLFEWPLIAFGFAQMIRKKVSGTYQLIGWGVIVILVASLTREAPHATRSFFLLVPLVVFSAMGALSFYSYLCSLRKKNIRLLISFLSGGFVLFNIFYYFTSYYFRFPILYADAWRVQDRLMSEFLITNGDKYEMIIFDEDAGFVYTSLLFYSKYDPVKFQESVKRMPDDNEGFSKVRSFGKYEFRKINWEEDIRLNNTLLITRGENKPSNFPIKNLINLPKKPVVFAADQMTHSIFVEDEVYAMVETK